jgi:chaperonin cofactor prefoldin
MSKAKIQNLVEQLQQEIDQVDNLAENKKQKLENLIKDIESGLEEENVSDELNASLTETVADFEASYPRLTAIINDIMVTLSNLGI